MFFEIDLNALCWCLCGSCWDIAIKYSNVRALEREKIQAPSNKTPHFSHLWFPRWGGGLDNTESCEEVRGWQLTVILGLPKLNSREGAMRSNISCVNVDNID